MSPANRQIAKAIIQAQNIAPSEKRKALRHLGVNVEYQPHQGAKEIARRLSKNQQGGA